MENNANPNTGTCQGGNCSATAQANVPAAQAAAGPAVNAAGQEIHHPEKVEAKKTEPGRTYVPAVDIIDNGDDTLLVIDMPGVRDADVELTLEKNILSIEASPSDQICEGKDLVYSEYGVGEFKRSFSLTEDIDRESIGATLKDGVLTVTMKKMAPVTKKISVGS